jgi:ribosomal protein L7/L12
MFVPLWILVPAVLLLLWLLSRALNGGRGDMIERQQRAAAPVSPQQLAQAFADPEISAAIEGGHKIEAIKLVRERLGLDLKGAKDLIESRQPAR